jgi:hypothetical protein
MVTTSSCLSLSPYRSTSSVLSTRPKLSSMYKVGMRMMRTVYIQQHISHTHMLSISHFFFCFLLSSSSSSRLGKLSTGLLIRLETVAKSSSHLLFVSCCKQIDYMVYTILLYYIRYTHTLNRRRHCVVSAATEDPCHSFEY